MIESDLLYWTLVTGVLSALATGLGAPLVSLVPFRSGRVHGFASAVAAGMMISASVFSLAQEGIEMEGTVTWATPKVVAGLLLGTVFLSWLSTKFGDDEEPEEWVGNLDLSRQSVFLFVALLIHSSPEGVAIGVGFATGDVDFGIMMALAISIHNIPEGIAMSLPMQSEGASVARSAGVSILTSVPQPIFAVPAALAFHYFQPWLPLGLGFAGGAMIFVVVVELIPDALDHGDEDLTAWGVMVGLAGMLALSAMLPGG